jgi:hypothetical protein
VSEIYTPEEIQMLVTLKGLVDNQALRYAKTDFLYWFEFQNKCSAILEKYVEYLGTFSSNQDILSTKESQRFFVDKLNSYLVIVLGLFEIINSEKCTNIAYFALSDDVYNAFGRLFALKVLGIESVTMRVFELFDSLLLCCSNAKQSLKYGSPNQMNLGGAIIDPFVKAFIDTAVQMSRIRSKKVEAEIVKQKMEVFKSKGFVEVEGLEYSIYKAYEFTSTVVLLSMNIALVIPTFKSEQFEKDLPPQYIFEILIETLSNSFVPKDVQI